MNTKWGSMSYESLREADLRDHSAGDKKLIILPPPTD